MKTTPLQPAAAPSATIVLTLPSSPLEPPQREPRRSSRRTAREARPANEGSAPDRVVRLWLG